MRNQKQERTGSSFAELMNSGYSLSDCLAIIGDAATEQGLTFGDMWSSSEAAKAGLVLLGDSAETFNGTLAALQNSTGATATGVESGRNVGFAGVAGNLVAENNNNLA